MLSGLAYRTAARLPAPLRRMVKRLPGAERLRAAQVGRPSGPSPGSGSLRPVVYLPTWITWDHLHERPHFILETFAATGHPVYMVDPRQPAPRSSDGVEIVPDLRFVPGDHVTIYTHFPKTRTLIDRFDDPFVIYDILDDISMYAMHEAGLPKEQRAVHHHTGLVADADVVIASNPVLADRHRPERADILLIENGVNVARFSRPAPRPPDLPEGILIGYHGSVQPWFDFDLFETVARDRPDWEFVVVGPVNSAVGDAASRATALANVTFLGERPPDQMPAYAQAFDVGVLWRVVDHMTAGMTPLKLNEYLAAGTPVVSTPLPASEAALAVLTAPDAKGIVSAIEGALQRIDDSAWQTLAATAAADAEWTRRIDPLLRRLEAEGGRWVP